MNVKKAIYTFTVMHLYLSSHLYFVIEEKKGKERKRKEEKKRYIIGTRESNQPC